ncbi:DBF4-type zinc finger-containing protein 2 [Sorex fumeus]|uniref:DBF4-type zinc finger-containing protein 2 n=1 Tax=Sorex fumeus TaxID=62283 RepID=UPI0024AD28E8|nr:DBF4-type zinc finger-containing protein 2 [Sorex fumeus]
MQNQQGYCSYCCVSYNNLDQHIASPEHRFMTAQNRQWMGTTSLMERFLQDVLWHHPYHSQESRSVQNERPMNASPSQLVPVEVFPEEVNDDDTEDGEERLSMGYESDEELDSRSSEPQENIQNVSIRPSVIQKLEKGQQQPLDFACKSGNGLKEFNPVGVSQATNNGQNVARSSVSSNVHASCLPEISNGRPVTANTSKLPQVAHLDSVSDCDPSKADRYFEQRERGSRNTVLTSCVNIPSVSCQKPKESDQNSVHVNSKQMIIQEDIKTPDKTLSTELAGTGGSLKCESLSKLEVNLPINLSKNKMPSHKGIFEDSFPKQNGDFPNRYCAQGEKYLVNKSAFLQQKTSAGSGMKFGCGYLQSSSDQYKETVLDLRKEKQIDQEKKNALGSSEMSFDYDSSFYLPTHQSKVVAKEANLSKEEIADLLYTNGKSYTFEASSNFDGFPQLAANQIHGNVEDTNLQNTMPISLVDECYNSSDSEINFDCDVSFQPSDGYLQQSTKVENLPKGVYIGLVDRNYGSSSSEISADSSSPLESVVDQLPVAVMETKPQKYHIYLVDKDYGSSCSEASFDDESIVDHPQLTVKERSLKDNHAYLKDKNHNPSSADAHLGFEIVTGEPQEAVKEINLLEASGPMDMNSHESQGLKINFHAHLVADQSQVALREVDPQEVASDVKNKSVKSSASELSFVSNASLYQPTNNQPQEALSENNVEESNIDMEVKSFGCSSSDLTFNSDPPFLTATEHSEIDNAGIRKGYKNLEDKNYGSDSSDITFDSDISLCSEDQFQVAVYEKKPIDSESKRTESCISEIHFDSDMPLHSNNDQPLEVVKEIIVKKEEYVHLERKNDEPHGSEIRLDSYVSPHSVTNLKNEEWAHLENLKYEPSGSELNLDYNIFHSVTKLSDGPIKETNFQRKEDRYLENKNNEHSISETSMKSGVFLVTGHPDLTAKEINQKKEPASMEDNGNRLSVSETSLYSTIPLQSVTHIPEVVVQEIWLQKEKHVNSKDKMAESSDSEINSDSEAPHYLVNEPQIALKEINVQKEVHVLGNKSVIRSCSEMFLDPGIPSQSMTDKPQIVILNKDHIDPGNEHPESRGFEINLNKSPLHSVISESKLTLLKEKHVDLEGANSEYNECRMHFYPVETLKPLTEQFQDKVKLWNEDVGLENKIDEHNGSKLNYSNVSLQSVAEQPEVAAKRIKLENQNHIYLGDTISQYNDPIMNLNSNFLVQSIVDQPQINILEQGHIELEEKHHQFCGSEISFDSDGPVQLVADQLRETVKEISLWKDEIDVEEKRDAPKTFEIVYESGVIFQSVPDQSEDILKGINFWKKHADVEDKIGPSNSKISLGSNEPLQSVTHEFQENITELNLGKGHVCLDEKGYKIDDSGIIYVSHGPLPPVVEHPHILEEEHDNLGEVCDDLSGPGISFVSEDPLHSVTNQLQSGVTEICPWKEDHIYLEDKTYNLGNFEVNCDSDTPVHFVADKSAITLKEINLQTKSAIDLADRNYDSTISEIKCDSGICLQLKVDEPQVICKEINLQKEELLGMEEKNSQSEIICNSDGPLQIVVDQHGVSIKETNLEKMLVMDLVTGDSDCENISDSDNTFQPVVIDPPQMTVKGVNCINTEQFDLESESRDSFTSELRYACDTSSSLTKKSKDTFKVVNQKKDYIILQESSCESYGSEINFQVDPTPQTVTCQSQGPDKKKMKYNDSEDKNCELNSPSTSFKWEDPSQSVTHQRQKVDKKFSSQKDGVIINLQDKNHDSRVSELDCSASAESTHHQNVDKVPILQLEHLSLESMSCEPSCSKTNCQSGSSLVFDPYNPQKAVNKVDFVKKMSYTLKERKQDSDLNTVLVVDSESIPDQVHVVIEDNHVEPVLEALPHIPPSFVGKTWSQIMKEDDMKINALVKEFREGRFHCYFDDDCETCKNKKKILNKEEKITRADLGQDTASNHILSADNASLFLDISDLSVALDKFSHHSLTKMPYDQPYRAASRCQTVKLNHGTQTPVSHPGTKRTRQGEDSPKRKHSNVTRKRKKRVRTETLEFPQTCTHILKPLQPNALLYVLSSNVYKIKEDESLNVSKMRPNTDINNGVLRVQYKYKWSTISGYDTLNQQMAVDTSPPKMEMPEHEGNIWVNIHFDESSLNAGDKDDSQNSVKDELMTQERDSGHFVSLEKPEILNSNEVPKESNFQLSLSNCDAAKIPPTSVRGKVSESKKKIQRRKLAARKSDLPQRAYKPVILQQKKRIASEAQSIWIQTKLNGIIRKYITKYSIFLRHKYQSRSTYIRTYLKKKSDAGKSKKPKRQTQIPSNSVPSGAEEKETADANSSLKQQPVQGAQQEPPEALP